MVSFVFADSFKCSHISVKDPTRNIRKKTASWTKTRKKRWTLAHRRNPLKIVRFSFFFLNFSCFSAESSSKDAQMEVEEEPKTEQPVVESVKKISENGLMKPPQSTEKTSNHRKRKGL